ncbi:hypothetical protein KQ302_00455 [Synechococcus sp. CS-602]|uniref:hypothetical protein n=1 Tax=Synechococcaceae TaxID=1890426 RepID=UPI0011A9AAD7|nr:MULTISPECIES: hypothetical protein [Synechococcaceae]MCT0203594.1 hypothetical protein [Synechococcus sp. CS-602]MCT0246039.1 hypothetical protein [Synechococcus sp. CS-601]MCT4365615.1 hypothetical protein [Candidatus Regnicoccus frigidus MAG-AL1]MCT4368637.1 hypothetical protein [Candidatus Regnicoccus frigidus MAG-AL2]
MAALFAAYAVSGSVRADLGSLLRVGQPIVEADRHLRAKGWRPAPQRRPDALDRERAGNTLASLSACSGGAPVYCRYDYRGPNDRRDGTGSDGTARQSQLVVITSDTATEVQGMAKAKVVRWSNEGPQGGRWGLCQQEADQPLLPCEGR